MSRKAPPPLRRPIVPEHLRDEIPDTAPFLWKINKEYRRRDLPVLLSVPLVLLAVYQLPVETRDTLVFSYTEPTITTAFTANYVHLTVPHLLSNLGVYVIVATVGYLLALSNGTRTRFFTVFFVVLLAIPIPVSYLNLAIPRPGLGFGFSGLNMALFGYVLVELAAYLDAYFTTRFGVENAPAFFFLVMAAVAAPHADSTWGLGITLAGITLSGLYSLPFLRGYRLTLAGITDAIDKQGYFELLIVTILLSVAIVPIAFPHNPIIETGITNTYSHLVGFCLGFITVYTWILIATPADPENAIPITW